MLHACIARPIEGLVNFIGYGFVSEGPSSPEVRGFMVMELIKGDDLRHVVRQGQSAPRQRSSSALAPPQGALGGSGQL